MGSADDDPAIQIIRGAAPSNESVAGKGSSKWWRKRWLNPKGLLALCLAGALSGIGGQVGVGLMNAQRESARIECDDEIRNGITDITRDWKFSPALVRDRVERDHLHIYMNDLEREKCTPYDPEGVFREHVIQLESDGSDP